jgi:hypothetical protein
MSHAGTLGARTTVEDSINTMVPRCIVAEGVGERGMKDSDWYRSVVDDDADAQPVAARDVRWNDIRLHRIRRSIMLFDFRADESRDVVDLAIAPAHIADTPESIVV